MSTTRTQLDLDSRATRPQRTRTETPSQPRRASAQDGGSRRIRIGGSSVAGRGRGDPRRDNAGGNRIGYDHVRRQCDYAAAMGEAGDAAMTFSLPAHPSHLPCMGMSVVAMAAAVISMLPASTTQTDRPVARVTESRNTSSRRANSEHIATKIALRGASCQGT